MVKWSLQLIEKLDLFELLLQFVWRKIFNKYCTVILYKLAHSGTHLWNLETIAHLISFLPWKFFRVKDHYFQIVSVIPSKRLNYISLKIVRILPHLHLFPSLFLCSMHTCFLCTMCTLVWFVSPCASRGHTWGGVLESMIYIVGPLPNNLSFWERWFLQKKKKNTNKLNIRYVQPTSDFRNILTLYTRSHPSPKNSLVLKFWNLDLLVWFIKT